MWKTCLQNGLNFCPIFDHFDFSELSDQKYFLWYFGRVYFPIIEMSGRFFRFTWIIFIACLVNLELAVQIWQLNFCFHFICLQISRKFNAKTCSNLRKKIFFNENLWAEANICVLNYQIKIEINIECFRISNDISNIITLRFKRSLAEVWEFLSFSAGGPIGSWETR